MVLNKIVYCVVILNKGLPWAIKSQYHSAQVTSVDIRCLPIAIQDSKYTSAQHARSCNACTCLKCNLNIKCVKKTTCLLLFDKARKFHNLI